MQDPSLPLTLEEIGEWGDPRIREHQDNIASYCSCHNIIPQVNHSDVTSTTVQKFGLGMIFFKPIKKPYLTQLLISSMQCVSHYSGVN